MMIELIKQKAKEYLELSDTIESYYGLNKQEVIMTAFADGAEAMREIANTWIPISEKLPEGDVILKGATNDSMLCGGTREMTERRIKEFCNDYGYTHWKPITL